MKTNFTNLRNAIFVLLLSLAFTSAFSQNGNPAISNLTATVVNNNLVMNWNVSAIDNVNYCEVQASKDGITFSTIGLVMGADPKEPNSFKFKQGLKKLKSGQVYYRVLNVENSGKSYVSNAVTTIK